MMSSTCLTNPRPRLQRLEDRTGPEDIQHVITVTYVNSDGSPTGGGCRMEGPFPDGNWRKAKLSEEMAG